jgi:hypothetical protein
MPARRRAGIQATTTTKPQKETTTMTDTTRPALQLALNYYKDQSSTPQENPDRGPTTLINTDIADQRREPNATTPIMRSPHNHYRLGAQS